MVGWHHWLGGHEFGQNSGDGEGQGSLVCCSSWGCEVGHHWVTEQQFIEPYRLKNGLKEHQNPKLSIQFIPTALKLTCTKSSEVFTKNEDSWAPLGPYHRYWRVQNLHLTNMLVNQTTMIQGLHLNNLWPTLYFSQWRCDQFLVPRLYSQTITTWYTAAMLSQCLSQIHS